MIERKLPDNRSRTDDSDIVRADSTQLRLLRRWAIAALLIMSCIWLLFRYWSGHANPYDLLHRMYALAYVSGFALLAAAWHAWRYARRVLASAQYPPPGGWVLGQTRVRRDRAARIVAIQIIVCACILAVLGAYALYLPHAVTLAGRRVTTIQVDPPLPAPATSPAATPHSAPSPSDHHR